MSGFKKIINLLSVILGIAICLYGAIHGKSLDAIPLVLLLLLVHISLVNYRVAEACIIIISGIVGSFTEVVNISFGFYDYIKIEEQTALLPTWIVLLWFLIGSSARHALSVFASKSILIPVAGLLGGLAIFAAGGLSGAIRFQPVDKLSMVLAVLTWSVALSFILVIANRFVAPSNG